MRCVVAAVAFGLMGAFGTAEAVEAPARLIRPPAPLRIKQLSFRENVRVETVHEGNEVEVLAVIEGFYKREYGSLMLGEKRISVSGVGGEFQFRVPLAQLEEKVHLFAVTIAGQIQHETVTVTFPNLEKYVWLVKQEGRPYLFNFGLGVTYIGYNDSNMTPTSASEFAITPKFGFNRHVFTPNLEFGGNIFFNAIPFGFSIPGDSIRFLGWNLRLGYAFPKIRQLPDKLRFSLLFGYYYVTSFVGSDSFGLVDMAGPQIFPTVRYTLSNGHVLGGYVKYSPVTNGLALLTLANRELALGLSYSFRLKQGALRDRPISISADFSNMALLLGDDSVNSTTVTLGASIGFAMRDITFGKVTWE